MKTFPKSESSISLIKNQAGMNNMIKRPHVAALAAVVFAGSVSAQVDRVGSPPEQWAAHLADVRKAEAIADPEQRCLAYPDMPGNAWFAGSAAARCALLRKPRHSLSGMQKLLAQQGGAETLERDFQALLDGHHAAGPEREQIFVAFDVFDGTALARQVADIWIELAPGSAFARTASGRQFAISAWDARGEKLASKTPEENFQRMHGLFARAVPELDKALRINPKVTPACQGMMMVSQATSDAALAETALAHCIQYDAGGFFVLQRWQWMMQPKWGGSLDALHQIDGYVGARVGQHPLLGGLLGSRGLYVAQQLAIDDSWAQAQPKLESAVRVAPEPYYLRWTGNAAQKNGDKWTALAYLSQSLRFSPDDDEARRLRALTRNSLGDFSGAISDAEIALQRKPTNGFHAYQLGEAHKFLHHTSQARAAYRISRDDPETHQQGLMRWCESFYFEAKDLPEALQCSKDMVAEFPHWGDAWFMRLRALDSAKDRAAFDAANQFLKYADMRNPAHLRIVDKLRADPVKWGIK